MTSETGRSVRNDGAGFIMVVLLIGMAVGAIWMAALLPAWRTLVIREQEAELVYRGESIARAIYLYRQKNGQALPPSLDVLVSGKYLRKKYRDPIADKDFMVVGGATAAPGGVGGGATPGPGGGQAGGQLMGGIIGVRSTSNDQSFRVYNNQQTYAQWAFDFTLEQLRAGAGVPGGGVGTPQGGARGGRQGQGGEVPPIGPGGRGGTGPGLGGRGGTGPGPGPGGGIGTPGGVRPPGGIGNPGGVGTPGGGGRRGGN
jgi:hypothetical protein